MKYIFLLAMSLLCLSCGLSDTAQAQQQPYKVVTTVGMVADVVRAVAGDRAAVTQIIGSGVDPHLYKPTRDDVALLMRADVIFYSGLMLEGKMADSLIKVGRSKPVFAVTELIDESALLQPEDMQGHFDPHVWMDPRAWSKAAAAVAQQLSTYDPPSASIYQANAAAFAAKLDQLHHYATAAIGSIPADQKVLITSHDAFNYLGRAYGIEVRGVQGLSTESEAGLRQINDLVDFLVSRKISAVFIESSVSPKNIQALIDGAASRGHKVVIGGELFSDAMGTPGTYEGTYIGMIDHNVTTIARALGGSAPAKGFQGQLSHVTPGKDSVAAPTTQP